MGKHKPIPKLPETFEEAIARLQLIEQENLSRREKKMLAMQKYRKGVRLKKKPKPKKEPEE